MSVMFVFLFFFFCPRNATAVVANVGHAGNVWLGGIKIFFVFSLIRSLMVPVL